MPAEEAKQALGETIWNKYKKVSIIRNPFDVAVSFYFWENKDKNLKPAFEDWATKNLCRVASNNYFYQINNKDIIDFYIRYGKLHDDLHRLESEESGLHGLSETFERITAKSGYRPAEATTTDLFSKAPKSFKLIYELHREQIERFNFDVPQTTDERPRQPV
ncbi:hypothetical protein [Halorhodospira halophila]|uniref:hypothetical protein n=1 Tax=Halorhodospira halophila TaxID=1053 RepID=UPI001F5DF2C6|nr:hypothetical protein [Halorhodospira halophila]